nr:MAG TPA: hypothetical protein [Caudoviricetes sp.]
MQMPCQGVVMGIRGISSMTKWQNCHIFVMVRLSHFCHFVIYMRTSVSLK